MLPKGMMANAADWFARLCFCNALPKRAGTIFNLRCETKFTSLMQVKQGGISPYHAFNNYTVFFS